MRMILPKLGNSPPSTPTEKTEKKIEKSPSPKQETPTSPIKEDIPVKSVATPVITPTKVVPEPPAKESPRVYQYRGPPSINVGTWSERPKSQVSLKEDKDYKISNIASVKAKFSSQTNLNAEPVKSKQQDNVASVNIRVNGEHKEQTDSGKINIKINSEPEKAIINQTPGNVIIKIGNINNEETNKPETKNFYSRFLNQTTAAAYRKPLGNINGVDKPRPRSIAFDSSCPDISRVPIVRSVELKKPFREVQNKSITQITHSNDFNQNGEGPRSFSISEYKQEVRSNTLGNRYSSVYVSSENVNNKTQQLNAKPVSRVNSFAFTRPTNTAPVVKGFRIVQNDTFVDNKTNWNGNHYGTLPAKPSNTPVNSVPFSQHTLKRTNHLNQFENKFSNSCNSTPIEKVVLRSTSCRPTQQSRNSTGSYNTVGLPNGDAPYVPQPPALPQLPKITSVTKKLPRQIDVDPRDQLLNAIRSFGGRAGLKPIK